jgi:predicted nucleic acid-binding protein
MSWEPKVWRKPKRNLAAYFKFPNLLKRLSLIFDSKTELVTKALSKDKFEFAVSAWGIAEAASALGRLVRRKEIESKLATKVLENIELFAAEIQVRCLAPP